MSVVCSVQGQCTGSFETVIPIASVTPISAPFTYSSDAISTSVSNLQGQSTSLSSSSLLPISISTSSTHSKSLDPIPKGTVIGIALAGGLILAGGFLTILVYLRRRHRVRILCRLETRPNRGISSEAHSEWVEPRSPM